MIIGAVMTVSVVSQVRRVFANIKADERRAAEDYARKQAAEACM